MSSKNICRNLIENIENRQSRFRFIIFFWNRPLPYFCVQYMKKTSHETFHSCRYLLIFLFNFLLLCAISSSFSLFHLFSSYFSLFFLLFLFFFLFLFFCVYLSFFLFSSFSLHLSVFISVFSILSLVFSFEHIYRPQARINDLMDNIFAVYHSSLDNDKFLFLYFFLTVPLPFLLSPILSISL